MSDNGYNKLNCSTEELKCELLNYGVKFEGTQMILDSIDIVANNLYQNEQDAQVEKLKDLVFNYLDRQAQSINAKFKVKEESIKEIQKRNTYLGKQIQKMLNEITSNGQKNWKMYDNKIYN